MNSIKKVLTQVSMASAVVAFFAVAPAATAQFAAYSNLAVTNRVSNQSDQDPHFASAGLGVGVYYDGPRVGKKSLGADVRGSFAANDKFGLLGFRMAVQPSATHEQYVPLRPYVEVLLGGGTMTDIMQNHESHMMIEGVGGVDLIAGHFDCRLFEVGIGRTPFNNSMGAAYTGGDLWIITVSSGLVYRF